MEAWAESEIVDPRDSMLEDVPGWMREISKDPSDTL
jgi:hypothetical protein